MHNRKYVKKKRQWEICQTLSYFLVRIEICDTYSRLFTMLEVEFGFPKNNRGVDYFLLTFKLHQEHNVFLFQQV